MPPLAGSRYMFCSALSDSLSQRFLTEREPFTYQTFADSRTHIVAEGQSLFTLAGYYFAPLPRACGLWWVIADFQPVAIYDPTLLLDVGRLLIIPSLRVVTDVILGEARRREVGGV
jgi:hypothetical protein